MLDEKHIDLLAKYFEGIITSEERRIIIRWRKEKSENEIIFNEFEEVWNITGKLPEDFQPNVSIAWEKVSNKIDDYESIKENKGFQNFGFLFIRVAAVFVIGFVIFLVYELNFNQHEVNLTELFETNTEIGNIVLPDSSLVWLNKNSEIKYPEEFEGNKRVILLNGEAYFEIKPNVDKPFIIKSARSIVTVLGTSFNYKANNNDDLDILIVNSGKVKFEDVKNSDNSVILEKGEKVEFDVLNKSLTKTINEDKNYLSWKTGILHFENETFENVVSDLSKYYRQQFEFSNRRLKNTRLSVSFDNQKLEDVLNILKLTLNASFKKEIDKIVIN